MLPIPKSSKNTCKIEELAKGNWKRKKSGKTKIKLPQMQLAEQRSKQCYRKVQGRKGIEAQNNECKGD